MRVWQHTKACDCLTVDAKTFSRRLAGLERCPGAHLVEVAS